MTTTHTPSQVLDRLVTAANTHDIDGLVDCFAQDYMLTDPVHPARSFTGSAQVRRNWTTMFAAVPDVHLDVQDVAVTESGFWLEAAQEGTRRDGQRVHNCMVFIGAVAAGRIASAHIYVAPVETGGPGIDTVFAQMAGAAPPGRDAAEGSGTPRDGQP